MGDDHPPVCDIGRETWQYRGNILVGKAVEPVTAYPLVIEGVGQGKGLLDLRCGAMKGSVETGDLGELRIELQCQADRRQIVRLVKQRQRHQGFKFIQQFVRYPRRRRMTQAAVHDAMSQRPEAAPAKL